MVEVIKRHKNGKPVIEYTEKECHKCHVVKPISEFYKHKLPSGLYCYRERCKDCSHKIDNERYHRIYKHDPTYIKERSEYGREWHLRNKERRNKEVSENAIQQRMLCIQHYGGKCSCCGESRYEFLAIDHINGGGGKHRKEIDNHIIRWLIKNDFPLGFRVLCHNCNQALGHYGYCPHQEPQKTLTSSVS